MAWEAGAAAASPERIVETAQEILARDYYHLENTVYPIAWAGRVLRWVREFLDWLDELLEGSGLPIPPSVFWSLMGLIVVALLVWWLFRLNANRIRATREAAEAQAEIDDLPADVRALLQRSNELAAAGNYVDASRVLYRAALVRLEEQRGGFLRRGLTNTEYIRTFRSPWVIESLRVFVDLINWKWYRARSFEAEDYRRCLDAYERLDARLREGV
jgi:hypothetical protein